MGQQSNWHIGEPPVEVQDVDLLVDPIRPAKGEHPEIGRVFELERDRG